MHLTGGRGEEVGILRRIVEDESARICAAIETAGTSGERDLALSELKQLAGDVFAYIQLMDPAAVERLEFADFEVAA